MLYIAIIIVHMNGYYVYLMCVCDVHTELLWGANGALVFVDLKYFKTRDERESIILHTEKLMWDLRQFVGTKLPCLLVGAKVRACYNYCSV